VRRHSSRPPRTIRRPVEVVGVGFLTGSTVRLRFAPAGPSAGVTFSRTDLPGKPRVAAHVGRVTDTNRRTTLGRAPAQVTLVEHVLAALAGLRIDNCLIEIDGVEPPGLDGSAIGFVEALVSAGVETQRARREVYSVEEAVTVSAGNASLTLHPHQDSDAPGLTLSYFLDYGRGAPIARQTFTCELTPTTFMQQVAAARTFLLEAEALEMRGRGLGLSMTAADVLVFGRAGLIDNELRHADEPARHKVLDVIGDLSLLGVDLWGHVVACRSGHPLNAELARSLAEQLASRAHAESEIEPEGEPAAA
jgi:UDP-3-O-acyl N-acetylglucosamine deacetylase